MSDTIAAISTSLNSSGIGIIRVSGIESISIVDSIFRCKKSLSEAKSHTIHYGFIYDGDEKIDEVIVLLFRAPRSYTTEDLVEIDCHGGVLVMQKILNAVISAGARAAQPGEFTKRAFLNGRIDLSQAEAVMDLISSSNDFAMKNSLNQMSGNLHDKIEKLRNLILHETAYIESALDDPEHYDLDGFSDELSIKVNNIKNEIDDLIRSFTNGSLLREGINTAIIGKPNAGKSSLLNTLSRRDRAIVTDIAGTTRDTLEEQIVINGLTLNIIDTAGIRETDDVVESIGVDKALSVMKDADLILYVVDSSDELDSNDKQIIDEIADKKAIVIFNKSDLDSKISKLEISEITGKNVISFSSKTSEGLKELEDSIYDMFLSGQIKNNNEVIITNARQKSCLVSAKESLDQVLISIDNMMPEDFLTIDLMAAYESLGLITGQTVDDDLANKIFSDFCMGK